MALSKFGVTVRNLRRQLELTLSTMAHDLETSPAFLSALETGRSKIPMEWAEKIAAYFAQKGLTINKSLLKTYACEANDSVSLEGLPPHHKMLIAGFANSDLNQEQLKKLGAVLSEIYGEKVNDE